METIDTNKSIGFVYSAAAMLALLVGARLVVRFTTPTLGTVTYAWLGGDDYIALHDTTDCRNGEYTGTQYIRFCGPPARSRTSAEKFLRDYHTREEATESRIARRA
jgi:hypothetical protein